MTALHRYLQPDRSKMSLFPNLILFYRRLAGNSKASPKLYLLQRRHFRNLNQMPELNVSYPSRFCPTEDRVSIIGSWNTNQTRFRYPCVGAHRTHDRFPSTIESRLNHINFIEYIFAIFCVPELSCYWVKIKTVAVSNAIGIISSSFAVRSKCIIRRS